MGWPPKGLLTKTSLFPLQPPSFNESSVNGSARSVSSGRAPSPAASRYLPATVRLFVPLQPSNPKTLKRKHAKPTGDY
jgi:hypothetical protein